MFHHVNDSNAFFEEVFRITKPEARLVFSGGHILRKQLKNKVEQSGLWRVVDERPEYIVYKAAVS